MRLYELKNQKIVNIIADCKQRAIDEVAAINAKYWTSKSPEAKAESERTGLLPLDHPLVLEYMKNTGVRFK